MRLPKTILYAEDDEVTLTAYAKRLEQAGYSVQAAVDGLEAIKCLHHYPPDLMLLDLMLPKFSGEEVLKYVSSNPALGLIPVIVLSTNTIVSLENEPFVRRTEKQLLKHECTFPKLLEAIDTLLADGQPTANAGELARKFKADHDVDARSRNAYQAAGRMDDESIVNLIRKMQSRSPVVCAWTDRINIDGKWMKLTEFLSERLNLTVTHGVSPEAANQLLKQ
jgi:CheY-like chemotaxis protein